VKVFNLSKKIAILPFSGVYFYLIVVFSKFPCLSSLPYLIYGTKDIKREQKSACYTCTPTRIKAVFAKDM
jgi:hypothetical protein